MSSVDSNPGPPELPDADELRSRLHGIAPAESDEECCALHLVLVTGALSMSCADVNGQLKPPGPGGAAEPWLAGRGRQLRCLSMEAQRLAEHARSVEAELASAAERGADETESEWARRAAMLRERALELPLELLELAAATARLSVRCPSGADSAALLPLARRAAQHLEARLDLATDAARVEEHRSVVAAVLREMEQLEAQRPASS